MDPSLSLVSREKYFMTVDWGVVMFPSCSQVLLHLEFPH